MPIAERNAHTTWEGTLAAGHGVLRTGSGALDGQEVTWGARTETPDGRTGPEELCAAARSVVDLHSQSVNIYQPRNGRRKGPS
jgi:osmotically inducible protein OsmC